MDKGTRQREIRFFYLKESTKRVRTCVKCGKDNEHYTRCKWCGVVARLEMKKMDPEILQLIYDAATESLDPANFENLEKALIRLAKTREIDWQPE